VVLHGAAARRGPHELDQAEAGELADVVAHMGEGCVELGRDLARAGHAVVQQAEDVDTQRVGIRLRYTRVGDVS
jgi:hypothetical protein